MKKIVVLVGLGLLTLTLAPFTHAGVASSLLDESCSLKMRDDMVAQNTRIARTSEAAPDHIDFFVVGLPRN